MQCSMPPPLSDEDLSLALDGLASQTILDHLARCESCTVRLQEARQIELALKTRVFRLNCPDAGELGDFHLGLIQGERVMALEAHLQRCPHCRAELEEIQAFLREEPATQPAPRPAEVQVPRRRNWRQVLATVLPAVPQPVLRGVASERIIRALVEDGTMLRLAARAEDGRVVVQGQILGDPAIWVGALVEVRQSERLLVVTTVLESGQFRFEITPADTIHLKITSESGPSILVNNIVLKDLP